MSTLTIGHQCLGPKPYIRGSMSKGRVVELNLMLRQAKSLWAGQGGEYPVSRFTLKVMAEVSGRESIVHVTLLEDPPRVARGEWLHLLRAMKEDVMRQLNLRQARVHVVNWKGQSREIHTEPTTQQRVAR